MASTPDSGSTGEPSKRAHQREVPSIRLGSGGSPTVYIPTLRRQTPLTFRFLFPEFFIAYLITFNKDICVGLCDGNLFECGVPFSIGEGGGAALRFIQYAGHR